MSINNRALSETITINSDRLWAALMEMAKIGPGVAGGNNRQALTDADAAARALFQQWCEQAGMTVGIDNVGNMFARRAGSEPAAPPVYIGSHLDTQPTGGKYDGVLGVLAALEAVRTLNEQNFSTRAPLVVVNWSNEEGARFAPPMFGSGVFAGVYSAEWAYAQTDAAGKRYGDELKRIGWCGDETAAGTLAAYYELHIEQGPVLETEEKLIGVVTHGQGVNWLEVTLTGKASHSGCTPMTMRANAGLAMAQLIQSVDDIAQAQAPLATGTVGHCRFLPNSPNVIPGEAVAIVDFRHPQQSVIEAMAAALRARVAQISAANGLQAEIKDLIQFSPVTFAPACVNSVRGAAERLGYPHRDIISGAGHDACWINRIAPSAMIMCPCIDGLSHNEAEEILPQWAAAGANVLLHAAVDTAGAGG